MHGDSFFWKYGGILLWTDFWFKILLKFKASMPLFANFIFRNGRFFVSVLSHTLTALNSLFEEMSKINCKDYKLQIFLPTVGFEPGPFRLRIKLDKRCSISWDIYWAFKCWPRFTGVCYEILPDSVPRVRCSKMFCRVLHFIYSLQSAKVLLIQTLKQQNDPNIIWQKYTTNHFAVSTTLYR